jgi:hypothetical protein
VDNLEDNVSVLSSKRSVDVNTIIKNYYSKQDKQIQEDSFLKLYWDISDSQSRAIKSALMACGIKHEGWSTDRLS